MKTIKTVVQAFQISNGTARAVPIVGDAEFIAGYIANLTESQRAIALDIEKIVFIRYTVPIVNGSIGAIDSIECEIMNEIGEYEPIPYEQMRAAYPLSFTAAGHLLQD